MLSHNVHLNGVHVFESPQTLLHLTMSMSMVGNYHKLISLSI